MTVVLHAKTVTRKVKGDGQIIDRYSVLGAFIHDDGYATCRRTNMPGIPRNG